MFDVSALKTAVACHGRVARVVIAAYSGSSPREVGAAMLVWADGQSGTVGGGAVTGMLIALRMGRLRACPACSATIPIETKPAT